MGDGGFTIDLVLFGAIAAFLVLRLRSILGKRTGFEGRPAPAAVAKPRAAGRQSPIIDAKVEAPPTSRILPDPASPTGQALSRMQGVDRSFEPGKFLAGAEAAFRLIVGAFAAGDRTTLRPLLNAESFDAFAAAISAREEAGETQRTEIRAITAATIETATLLGSQAEIAVRFVSDQVNLTLDRVGNPVTGTEGITELHDLWSFERDLSRSDPAWRLTAARSA